MLLRANEECKRPARAEPRHLVQYNNGSASTKGHVRRTTRLAYRYRSPILGSVSTERRSLEIQLYKRVFSASLRKQEIYQIHAHTHTHRAQLTNTKVTTFANSDMHLTSVILPLCVAAVALAQCPPGWCVNGYCGGPKFFCVHVRFSPSSQESRDQNPSLTVF